MAAQVLAVTMNDMHTDVLFRHLMKRVLTAMVEPTSPAWLFEPHLAELRADGGGKPATPAPAPTPAPPTSPPPKAAAQLAGQSSPKPSSPAVGQQSMLDKLKQMLDEKKNQGKPQ